MKRTILAVALLALAVTAVLAERFIPAGNSVVRIEGTSTLHAWKMEGSTIEGQVSAPPIEQWQNATAESVVSVAIPVKSIKSEHSKMDKLMVAALKADKNPTIRYELSVAKLDGAVGATFTMNTRGTLTIAGTTREVEMKVAGTREPSGSYALTGTLPIRMTDYGIKPPTAMMGTIRTGNNVTVTFRWLVAGTR